jgi:hypothetical protein
MVLSGVVLDQIFQSNLTNYTATVSQLRSTTTVTATPSDPDATITVNGIAAAAGVASAEITLNQGDNTITVVVTAEDGVATTTYTIEVARESAASFAQTAYLKASNTGEGDVFGVRVALDGATLAVGAIGEQSGATGINGDQLDNSAFYSGAVYVFFRDPSGVGSQQAYLKASNSTEQILFGYSLALDGDTLAVGAPDEDNGGGNSGAVYVFTRDGSGVWTEQAYLKASNAEAGDGFGFSVALDSDTLAVGAIGEASGATGIDGDQSDNSVGLSGAVYVFNRDAGGIWSQQAYIKASNTGQEDDFGGQVALSGDTLAVGAFGEGSSATGVDGDQADNNAFRSGAVYVFTRDASDVWSQQAYVKASNTDVEDRFGFALDLDSNTLAVGAHEEDSSAAGINGNQSDNSAGESGAVYVFTRDASGVWAQQAYLKAFNTDASDEFGIGLSLQGDSLAVGAFNEDSSATGINGDQSDNSAGGSGAVYLFTRHASGAWNEQAFIKASNTGIADQFGISVALDGDTLVVGADRESGSGTGLTGDQADDSAQAAGAVYIFR